MGFAIRGKESSFETFPAGEYRVNGIEAYISTDGDNETGMPIFVPSSVGDGMIARLRFRLENGESGPPWSATRAQLAALVYAFGGDPDSLPQQESTEFLLKVQKLINERKSSVAVAVNDKGWTKFVEGAQPPTGEYLFRYAGGRSKNGKIPLEFVSEKRSNGRGGHFTSETVYTSFELVSNSDGSPSPFAGFMLTTEANNGFEGISEDGRPVNKVDGRDKDKPAEEQRQSTDFTRWLRFIECFCPEMLGDTFTWMNDPTQSKYGVSEALQPVVVIDALAKKNGRLALGSLDYNDRGYVKFDFFNLKPVDGNVEIEAVDVNEGADDPEEYFFLWRTIDELGKAAGLTVLENPPGDTIEFLPTEEGKEWLGAVVKPVWMELPGMPETTAFTALSPEQAERLAYELIGGLGTPKLRKEMADRKSEGGDF